MTTINAAHRGDEFDGDTILETRKKVKQPKLYRVIMLNDDYTSMEFVVFVLQEVFLKSTTEAESLMMSIHLNGSGVAGVFTREIAETKIAQVTELAKLNEFPLKCIMEEE